MKAEQVWDQEVHNYSMQSQIKTCVKASSDTWTSGSEFPYMLRRKKEGIKEGG